MLTSALLRRLVSVAQWLADLATLPTMLLTAALSAVMMLDGIPLIGLLIPADAAVMTAMAARGPIGSGPVLAGVIGGYLVSASLGFFIGRYFGPQVRGSRFGAWIGESRWTAGEQMLATSGRRMLLAAPFLPVVNTMVPLVAGGLRMPYRHFLAAVGIGSTLWSTLYVTLGALAGLLSRSLHGGSWTTIATVLVGTLLSCVSIRGARRLTGLTPVPAPTA